MIEFIMNSGASIWINPLNVSHIRDRGDNHVILSTVSGAIITLQGSSEEIAARVRDGIKEYKL